MAFTLQANKNTTLAADLLSGATTGTLSSAAFTNFTGDYLVVDYDVPAKYEIILCTVTGTAISAITRAQSGTSNVDHTAGAKIAYDFVPGHYAALGEVATGSTLTTFAPAATGFTGTPTVNIAKYLKIGRMVYVSIDVTGTSNATTSQVTLPFAAARLEHFATGLAVDNAASLINPVLFRTIAGSATCDVAKDIQTNAWTASGTKRFAATFWYEATT